MALMVIIVFVNTVLRYCFNSGIVENEEVLRYLFIWATFLGIMAVYKEKRHIAVTMVTDKLSPSVANVFSFCTNILVLYAFYVLVEGSFMYIEASETTIGQMTHLPFVYIIIASTICGIAVMGMVLIEMYQQLMTILGKGAN